MSQCVYFPTLKKRREFLRLQKEGKKWVAPAFVIQSAPFEGMLKRIGYITTRKLGSAVVRNRVRRRLREVIRFVFPLHAKSGYDYVVIAKSHCINQDFLSLKQDMIWALGHLHRVTKEKTEHKIEKDTSL